ncbi:hypothetical protein A1356_15390 [Methylomonas koyamae]|uniref:Uncharacterized protein n=1 Tax=Methylomonas koyamae TaxID=702114 RepID=A0AA91I4J6_9GAMM|nr:hypothetical protein A1356_15390 [Methylomonas koyamae]
MDEAAKKLSESGIGEGTEASVLRMALDNDLQLSVYFKDKAYVVTGRIVHVTEDEMCIAAAKGVYPEQLKWKQIEGCEDMGDIFLESIYLGKDGFWLGGGDFLNIEYKKVYPIGGLWDLIMVHDGRQSIEDKWFTLDGGINENKIISKGIYIQHPNGTICQLRKLFDQKEYQAKFELRKKQLQENLSCGDITNEEFDKQIYIHEEDRREHLKKIIETQAYSEISGLPQNCALVVRAEEIDEFVERFSEPNTKQKNSAKVHGGALNNTRDRENIFGAAFALVATDPNAFRAKNGNLKATQVAQRLAVEQQALFPNGKLPMEEGTIADHLSSWINKIKKPK